VVREDFFAQVIDATDLYDDMVEAAKWIQLEKSRVLAQREATASIGAILIHPTQGWHDTSNLQSRYTEFLRVEAIARGVESQVCSPRVSFRCRSRFIWLSRAVSSPCRPTPRRHRERLGLKPALVAGELLDRIGRRHPCLLSEAADGRSPRAQAALSVVRAAERF
jgi:hypothetical protein